jgi:hypothetical protein
VPIQTIALEHGFVGQGLQQKFRGYDAACERMVRSDKRSDCVLLMGNACVNQDLRIHHPVLIAKSEPVLQRRLLRRFEALPASKHILPYLKSFTSNHI